MFILQNGGEKKKQIYDKELGPSTKGKQLLTLVWNGRKRCFSESDVSILREKTLKSIASYNNPVVLVPEFHESDVTFPVSVEEKLMQRRAEILVKCLKK